MTTLTSVPSITIKHVAILGSEHRDTLKSLIRDAIALWGDIVNQECHAIAAHAANNRPLWARFVVMKGILSNGALLGSNIVLARMLRDAIESGRVIRTHKDCEDIREASRYGARSVNTNIDNALFAYNDMRERGAVSIDTRYRGMGPKIMSWAAVLDDYTTRTYTLDAHMVGNIATILDLDTKVIANAAYPKLAALMLELHDEVCPQYAPLVSQWSLWNEFRHAGKHASHLDILN